MSKKVQKSQQEKLEAMERQLWEEKQAREVMEAQMKMMEQMFAAAMQGTAPNASSVALQQQGLFAHSRSSTTAITPTSSVSAMSSNNVPELETNANT